MPVNPATREAIIRAANEQGIDPATALAVAERESNFDPNAHSSKTIHGIFQMTGGARAQHGVGSSSDPYTQAKGWGSFMKDVKREMSGPLGRAPTDAESYLGHHFGGVRAGRMLKMDPNTPVTDVFTAQEMAGNPHFARAGTVGKLNSSVMADIERRRAKYGGAAGEPQDTRSRETPATDQETSKIAGDIGLPPPHRAAKTAVASAATPPTPTGTGTEGSALQTAVLGPNSFKGLPDLTPPSIEHGQLYQPQLPPLGGGILPPLPPAIPSAPTATATPEPSQQVADKPDFSAQAELV